MRIKISEGNVKLGRVPNLNLPPGLTCIPGVPCYTDGCYARKAYRMYSGTRKAWDSNLKFYKEDPEGYFYDLQEYVLRKRPPLFRAHSSGDMPDENYWFMLRQVAAKTPLTNYLVFTKRYGFSYRVIPKNVSLVLSVWPGLDLPNNKEVPWAWLYEDERRPDCAYYFVCKGDCSTCSVCWGKL